MAWKEKRAGRCSWIPMGEPLDTPLIPLSDLLANQRDATEPTVKSIPLMQRVFFCRGWHSELDTLIFGNAGWRILYRPILNIRAVAAPQGFCPFPDHRKIGVSDQFMGQRCMAIKVSLNCGLQQTSCLCDFGYRVSETGANTGNHVELKTNGGSGKGADVNHRTPGAGIGQSSNQRLTASGLKRTRFPSLRKGSPCLSRSMET